MSLTLGTRLGVYQTNESGGSEIYVRPFVPPGAAAATAGLAESQWQVSTAGGFLPVWRPDGKELYYINLTGELMAAPITVVGDTLQPGAPVVLFPTPSSAVAGGRLAGITTSHPTGASSSTRSCVATLRRSR